MVKPKLKSATIANDQFWYQESTIEQETRALITGFLFIYLFILLFFNFLIHKQNYINSTNKKSAAVKSTRWIQGSQMIKKKKRNKKTSHPLFRSNQSTRSRIDVEFISMDLFEHNRREFKNNIYLVWSLFLIIKRYVIPLIPYGQNKHTMGQPSETPSNFSPETSLANLVEFLLLKTTIPVHPKK